MQIYVLILLVLPVCFASHGPIVNNYCVASNARNGNWTYPLGVGQTLNPEPVITANGIATVSGLLHTISFGGQSVWNYSSYAMQTIDMTNTHGGISSDGFFIAAMNTDAYGNIFLLTSNNMGLSPYQSFVYSVVALNGQGISVWEADLLNVDAQQMPSIYAAGSSVYVTASFNGTYHVISLDAATGKYNWQLPFNSTYGLSVYSNKTDDSVIFVLNYQTFYAVSTSTPGTVMWKQTAPDYAGFTMPMYEGSTLYIMVQGALLPYIVVYDLSNIMMPEVIAKYMLAMPATNAIYADNIIYALEYGYLEAINVKTPSAPVQKWNISVDVAQTGYSNLAISCGASTPKLFWNSVNEGIIYKFALHNGQVEGKFDAAADGDMVGTMYLVSDDSLLFFVRKEAEWPTIDLLSVKQSMIK